MLKSICSPALLSATLTLGILGAIVPAQSDEADFFKDKMISLTVGYPPGGGYDAYGRLFVKFAPMHIPGAPTVILRNMPGASGLVAANVLYNKAPKDGTSLAMFSSSAAFSPLFKNERAQFQTEKFSWIGVLDQTTSTCATWHTSGIKSFEDLKGRTAIFGAASATALNSEHPRAFNALLGTRIQVIHGYPGGTSILLAMQRGEVHGVCSLSLSSVLSVRRDDFESGRLIPIIQTGIKRHPAIKDVPNIYEFAKNDEERQIFNILFGRHAVGRPIVAPPGLPPERVRTLRAAFDAMVADKAFIAEAAAQNVEIEPLSGDETEKLVAELLATPPEIMAKTLKIIEVGKVDLVQLKTVDGALAKASARSIEIRDASGKAQSFRLSAEDSKVLIGGKEAQADALTAGMACKVEHFGEGDVAAKIDCN